MTPEQTINIAYLMSIVLFVMNCINFFSVKKKSIKDDDRELIKMNVKLEQICATTSETRSDIKSMNNQIDKINEEQIIQRQDIKAIWKYIDEQKKRV